MAGPTAILTQPAAIAAVTSARKLLVITYSVTDCARLLITVPACAVPCDCPLIAQSLVDAGTYEFAVLEDEAGQKYCEPSAWQVAAMYTTLTVRFTGIYPGPWAAGDCVTGIEDINDVVFQVQSGITDETDLCTGDYVNCGVPGGGLAEYVWSVNEATGQCYCPPNAQTWSWPAGMWFYKDYGANTYSAGVKIENCVWGATGIPHDQLWGYQLPVIANNSGWIGASGSYAQLLPLADDFRLRPTFDATGNLTAVLVEQKDPLGGEATTYATYAPAAPADCSALVNGISLTGDSGCPELPATITAVVDNGIDSSTIATGNIRVTGPLGYDEIATLVSVDVAGDGSPRVATYSIAPPENNIWCWQYNGTYTVSMVAVQVADLGGQYAAAGALGTFLCSIEGEPILEPLFLAGYLMAATETLVFPMRLADDSALDATATPAVLIRTTAGTWVAPTSGPTNDGHGYYSVTVTSATHFSAYGTLQLLATAAGCRPTCQAYKAGPIAADEQAIDGDFDAATYDREDLVNGYAHGEVVAGTGNDYDYDSSYDYDYGCTPTTTVFCVKDLPLREDSAEDGTGIWRYGYAKQFARIEDNPTWKRILKSATYGNLTEITLERPLYEAPTVGATITIGGCTEFTAEV